MPTSSPRLRLEEFAESTRFRAGRCKLRVLHVLVAIREQSCGFNEFALSSSQQHGIAVCSYFPPEVEVPSRLRLFCGNGTIAGFVKALRAAIAAGPYDAVHVHAPQLAALAIVAAARDWKKLPSVFTAHHSYNNSNLGLRNRLMLLPVFLCYKSVVCVGEASLRSFPWLLRRLAGSRFAIIRNGVDLARVARTCNGVFRTDQGPFTVVVIARLIPIKNVEAVLAAVIRLDPERVRLVVIGDGPLRMKLERLAASRPHRVDFLGNVARETVYRHLAQADLFVSMSRGEGMPISVLEAMAAACPVILSDIAAHREIAEGTDFIPLLDPDDTPLLAEQIAAFADDRAAARASGDRCRMHVEVNFSLSTMHAGYERLYRQLSYSPLAEFEE